MAADDNKPWQRIDRRVFLKTIGAGFLSAAATTVIGCDNTTREAFLQKHFTELSKEELASVIVRLERDYEERLGRRVEVATTPPLPGVLFGAALDVSRCIGCRRCVYACVKENNQSRDPQIQWITVLELDKDRQIDPLDGNAYYDGASVPREGHFYLPVSCQQCRNPPCVKSCPVKATWQEPDGMVVIDYNWCIGCRCCMAACPYGARHFNWGTPKIPKDEINPETHYLGNRPRPRGVVEKCTFCIQRVRKGRYPACVEACPVGARKFGNLLDPNSEVRQVLDRFRVFILKQELNTHPKFFYFYGV